MPTEPEPKRFFYGWIIVGTSFFICSISFGVRFSFGVFLKPLIEEFSWTRAMTSGVFSVGIIIVGLSALIMGWLSDKYGPRIIIFIGGLLTGLGLILVFWTSRIWHLYIFYSLIASLGAAFYAPLAATASRWFVKRRALAIAIVASGNSFGIIFMPLLAQYLISSYSWRSSYIIMGFLTWITVSLGSIFLARNPAAKGLQPYGEEPPGNVTTTTTGPATDNCPDDEWSLGEALRTRSFWIFTTSYGLWCFMGMIPMVHIVAHATDIGIPPVTAAIALTILGVGRLISGPCAGAIADRIGRKKTLATCLAINIIMMVWLMAADNLWMFLLFAVIFGLAFGGAVPLWPTILSELFGVKAMGAIFGMVAIFILAASALGPVIAGFVFDTTGSYNPSFILGAITTIGAIALIPFFNPPKRMPGPAD